MPEPQIVIVVNSLTEAHKLERELVRDRQNACGSGHVKRMSAGFASTWGATPATHTKQPTFATCTISVLLHAGYATTLKQIYRGNEPMTAQEWLDELERLREAATPGPWEAWRYNAGFVRISTCPLDPDDDEVIKVADSPDITVSDTAYIVAACNAVPRLIEMVQDMSSVIAGMPGMESTPDEILQDFFEATEPEE